MRDKFVKLAAGPAVLAAVAAAGCGSGGHKAAASSTGATTTQASPPATTQATTTVAPVSTGPGALQAEANSAAAGDIPDNQVFLAFANHEIGRAHV